MVAAPPLPQHQRSSATDAVQHQQNKRYQVAAHMTAHALGTLYAAASSKPCSTGRALALMYSHSTTASVAR